VNDNKRYTTIADLLADDGFMAWHLKKNDRHEQTWNKWIAEKPEHAELANRAVQVLSVLIIPEEEKLSNQQIKASFDRLLKKINSQGKIIHNLT
jgi:hypothetical protein